MFYFYHILIFVVSQRHSNAMNLIFTSLMILYSIFIPNISTCVNMISKTRLWILAFSFVYVSYASSHDKCFILNSRNYLLVLKPHVSFAAWMFTRFKCRIMTYFKMYSMCNFNIILSWKTKKGWRRTIIQIILCSTKSNISKHIICLSIAQIQICFH